LVLYTGIAPRLVRLQQAGFQLIIITNQGGLAHGYFDDTALQHMHDYLRAEFAVLGVQLDAIYHCPHHPDGSISELAINCDCRKPMPGMLLRAASSWSLDLGRCWMVGDILHDVEAGNRAGCRTVLVDNGGETEWVAGPYRSPDFIAPDTNSALDYIIAHEGLSPVGDVQNMQPSLETAGGMQQ
jgi:D-glycero-D-manno-heptose 1,7-bisphosphate phosphatase